MELLEEERLSALKDLANVYLAHLQALAPRLQQVRSNLIRARTCVIPAIILSPPRCQRSRDYHPSSFPYRVQTVWQLLYVTVTCPKTSKS